MTDRSITRREFVKSVAAGGVSLSAGGLIYACSKKDPPGTLTDKRGTIGFAEGYSEDPPNIIIINADDLGYGDLGCYGSRAIQTPNIDSLADQGVRFTDFHACDSVCTPSRAGLLTGRYPKRMQLDMPLLSENMPFGKSMLVKFGFLMGKLGITDIATRGGITGIPGHEITLAEALKERNYRTGMVGKWHLGDYSVNPEHNPGNHGFDYYFGVPHSNDIHPFPLYRNKTELEPEVADQSKLTGLYTAEAINFIKKSKESPFFLYFAHTFPHRPLYASKEFKNRSEGGLYGDTVEEIDWSVGQILYTLKENNLDHNTLIMFTSDNGPWYQGSPGEFRGRKGQSYEGGHRVPFVARWGGLIKPGSVCTEPAMNIDLFPTCLAAAGLTLPDDRIVDGRDIRPLLIQENSRTPHDYFFFYHHGELEGIRTENWKYFRSINHYSWPMPVNKKFGSLISYTNGPLPLLFNLRIDPGESYNVIEKYPGKAEELEKVMARWEKAMMDNPAGLIHKK
ncbi:MAG: sulfatase [Desulfobacterales bacterium]